MLSIGKYIKILQLPNYLNVLSKFIFIDMSVDRVALFGANESAGTIMTKF